MIVREMGRSGKTEVVAFKGWHIIPWMFEPSTTELKRQG